MDKGLKAKNRYEKTLIIALVILAAAGCTKLSLDEETQAPKMETQKDTTSKQKPKKGLNIVHVNPSPVYA